MTLQSFEQQRHPPKRRCLISCPADPHTNRTTSSGTDLHSARAVHRGGPPEERKGLSFHLGHHAQRELEDRHRLVPDGDVFSVVLQMLEHRPHCAAAVGRCDWDKLFVPRIKNPCTPCVTFGMVSAARGRTCVSKMSGRTMSVLVGGFSCPRLLYLGAWPV